MSITVALLAWLGPAISDATPDQLDAIARAADTINAKYADPDLADDREAALTGAVQLMLGDDTLGGLGQAYRSAAAAAETARLTLVGAVIAAHQAGASVSAIAAEAGLSRPSVYAAIR